MASVMKWRSAGKMLERAAVSWMKMNDKELECQHRSSAVYHTPSETCAACLLSGFGSNVPQEHERDVPGTINQRCIDTPILNTDDFKLNPDRKEFISLSNQRQFDNQAYPAQSMILNSSADEFIPQFNAQSIPKMPLMINPNAEEFTPQMRVQAHPKKIMMFNTNAEEFTPQMRVQSHPKKIMMFNINAEEFTPQMRVQSHPKKIMMFNTNAEEFFPQLISKSLLKKPMMFNPSAEEFIPQLNAESLPKMPLMFNPNAEEFTPQLSVHSLPKKTLMFNTSAEEFIPRLQPLAKQPVMLSTESQTLEPCFEGLRNCTSDETSQNVPLNHSASDVCNTPVTSNAGESFIVRRNKDELRPRKIDLEDYDGDVAIEDNQTSDHLLEESRPTRSWTFNPSAQPFFSLVRYASLTSCNINETSDCLEQTHSESDPVKTKTSLDNSRLVRKESCRKRLDECNEHAADGDVQTGGNSQDSQFTESRKLNQCAQIFIPHPTDMSPVLPNTEDKNDNLEEIHAISDVDNRPVSFESSVCPNGIAQMTEDTAEDTTGAQTSCPSQEDHVDVPTHQVESPNLNPNVNACMPLLRNTQASHKTDSHSGKYSGEMPQRALHNSGIESQCASLSYELIQGELQPGLSAESRNCTSVVQEIDDTSQNVPQNHSALDVYNTPVTSNPGGSFFLNRNKREQTPRKTYLEKYNGDVVKENQTAGHSQEVSQPTRSWISNPSAEPFFSPVRNPSPSSCKTNETSDSLEQKHSESLPVKTALTQKLRELLRKLVNNSRLAREASCRTRLDEHIEYFDGDNAQTACNSQDSQLIESQKLNPCAQIFTPHPTDLSTRLLNIEIKNDNWEEITSLSNVDNRPTDGKLTVLSRAYHNYITQVTEDAVEAQTRCPPKEDYFDFRRHQVESVTLNPNAETFIPQLRNMSQVSHTTESYCGKNTVELSEISRHNSEREYMSHFYELSQVKLKPSLFADDNAERGSVLNRDFAMSTSTYAHRETPTQSLSTVTVAEQTITDVNNLTPAKVDIPSGDFRRTPRRPNKRPMPQHDEFMDNPNQQSSAWLEHGATVTDEADHDPTNRVVRLERSEMEAQRLRLKVSTMATDHALARAQHQLQINILHKKMAADKKELANMQVLMLDLIKQVAISRVDKKLMRAELQVTHLYETMGDQVSTSDMQNSYQVLCAYMTECNLLKLDIETLAQKLQEKLQNGKQIDLSVIEKYPPTFPELLV